MKNILNFFKKKHLSCKEAKKRSLKCFEYKEGVCECKTKDKKLYKKNNRKVVDFASLSRGGYGLVHKKI